MASARTPHAGRLSLINSQSKLDLAGDAVRQALHCDRFENPAEGLAEFAADRLLYDERLTRNFIGELFMGGSLKMMKNLLQN